MLIDVGVAVAVTVRMLLCDSCLMSLPWLELVATDAASDATVDDRLRPFDFPLFVLLLRERAPVLAGFEADGWRECDPSRSSIDDSESVDAGEGVSPSSFSSSVQTC